MSSEYERNALQLINKIRKIEDEITKECNYYMKKSLDEHKGYVYYSSEIDAIGKRQERDIEILEANYKEKIEALERQLEIKKQAILDKGKALRDEYIKNCSAIEENHKKPISKAFKMKEEELEMMKTKYEGYERIIDEQRINRQKQREEQERIRKRQEEADEKQQRAIALEKFYADRAEQDRKEEERRNNRTEEITIVETPYASELRNFGLKPIPKYPKLEKVPLNGRDINKMCQDELLFLDEKTLTPDQLEQVMDRNEYLDANPIESKELIKEFHADKKKERKEEKKNSKSEKPSG